MERNLASLCFDFFFFFWCQLSHKLFYVLCPGTLILWLITKVINIHVIRLHLYNFGSHNHIKNKQHQQKNTHTHTKMFLSTFFYFWVLCMHIVRKKDHWVHLQAPHTCCWISICSQNISAMTHTKSLQLSCWRQGIVRQNLQISPELVLINAEWSSHLQVKGLRASSAKEILYIFIFLLPLWSSFYLSH